MARVYALMAGQLVLYVGSTIQTLKRRESDHTKTDNPCASKHIPKDCEWVMKLLEECSADERLAREQYYYDLLKPLYNERNPIKDEMLRKATAQKYLEQYYQRNREKLIQRTKDYAENNKEAISERNKVHYENNKDVVCEKVRAYREANLEKVKAREKAYRENNREAVLARRKEQREKNKEAITARDKLWRENNKEAISARRKAQREKKKALNQ